MQKIRALCRDCVTEQAVDNMLFLSSSIMLKLHCGHEQTYNIVQVA